MYKRTFKSFIAMAIVTLLLATCAKKDENGVYFASNIDLKNSSIAADRTVTAFYFSVDNGVTFAAGQVLNVGQKYQARVVDAKISPAFNPVYNVDWSASNPKPSNASSQTPEFTMQSSNTLSVVVTGEPYCPLNLATWTGVWSGQEVPGSKDANNITLDGVVPNRLHMDNFWGDGVDVYMDFNPSTSVMDQTLTIPTQTTSEAGVASGTGTYDQCYGTFTINATYVIGSTYNFKYNFTR